MCQGWCDFFGSDVLKKILLHCPCGKTAYSIMSLMAIAETHRHFWSLKQAEFSANKYWAFHYLLPNSTLWLPLCTAPVWIAKRRKYQMNFDHCRSNWKLFIAIKCAPDLMCRLVQLQPNFRCATQRWGEWKKDDSLSNQKYQVTVVLFDLFSAR